MTEDVVLTLAQRALTVTILASLPILGATLVVGLLISIVQAATSIQEITLVFVPKILAVFFTLVLFGPFLLKLMVNYTGVLMATLYQYMG